MLRPVKLKKNTFSWKNNRQLNEIDFSEEIRYENVDNMELLDFKFPGRGGCPQLPSRLLAARAKVDRMYGPEEKYINCSKTCVVED